MRGFQGKTAKTALTPKITPNFQAVDISTPQRK
jgi:hypothetical protein